MTDTQKQDRIGEMMREYREESRRQAHAAAKVRESERDQQAALIASQAKRIAELEAAEASLASYKEEVERLRRVLAEARDDMQAWQSYASDYFRDKHDAAGDLAKIDQALTKETPYAD